MKFNNRIGKFRSAGLCLLHPASVFRECDKPFSRSVGGSWLLLRTHPDGEASAGAEADHCRGVGDVFFPAMSGAEPCTASKNGAVITNIRAGNKGPVRRPKSGRRGRRIDVPIKVFHQQHVVLVGIHYQLHAGVVHDVLAISDLGILPWPTLREQAQEKAVTRVS